jgi:hypothetical protein
MTSMLGYLPQHDDEAVVVAVGLAGLWFSVPALIRGRSSGLEGWKRSRVRLLAGAVILAVTGWVLFAFLANAEPPGGTPGGHWGTTVDKVTLGVWLAGIAAIFGYNIWRERSSRGTGGRRGRHRNTRLE